MDITAPFNWLGEPHIADVRTPSGLALELQHSAVKPDERRARAAIYGNMLWIVDGTRLKRDAPRVDNEIHGWRKSKAGRINLLRYPDWELPKQWLECEGPVLFDFDGLTRREDFPGERDGLPPQNMSLHCRGARLRCRESISAQNLHSLSGASAHEVAQVALSIVFRSNDMTPSLFDPRSANIACARWLVA